VNPTDDARTWSRTMLGKVSRTFALGILSLPEPLGEWVTVGYLLCRVADTVEDAEGPSPGDRQALFHHFSQALGGGDATPFLALVDRLPAGAEGELAAELPALLGLMAGFPPQVQAILRHWVGEMAHGMAEYAQRGDLCTSDLCALEDRAELARYCHFVAGTVGHMLTELFAEASTGVAASLEELRPHAEAFGLLLQLTNIVKDVTDDHARGWSFIPRAMAAKHGLAIEQLLEPAARVPALVVIGDVVALARAQIAASVAYVLAIPADEPALRRFCMLPMVLAMRTLDLAEGNPAVLTPDQAVKISRDAVLEVMEWVEQLLNDDAGIAALATA
jgi:phytoene/squalene synthetase